MYTLRSARSCEDLAPLPDHGGLGQRWGAVQGSGFRVQDLLWFEMFNPDLKIQASIGHWLDFISSRFRLCYPTGMLP